MRGSTFFSIRRVVLKCGQRCVLCVATVLTFTSGGCEDNTSQMFIHPCGLIFAPRHSQTHLNEGARLYFFILPRRTIGALVFFINYK